MSELPKPLEIQINGKDYSLLNNCAAVMFRKHVEIDYIAVYDVDNDLIARGFNHPDLVQWMAGFAYVYDEEEQRWHRHSTLYRDQTFEEAYGWVPIVIEKPEPSDKEKEAYLEVQAEQLATDLEEFERGNE